MLGNFLGHFILNSAQRQKRQSRSLALKAKKESSDDDSSTSESETKNTPWTQKNSRNSSKDEEDLTFIGGAWSDSGEDEEEKNKDESCLVAQASKEICLGINLEPDE
ncbi:hypothetical protein Tco_1114448 [Tanacetum coccineum]|uniref:Uncharacterized protein n=1 Tax=Tanacetum coccineum TaxID=301880 RepID=A0ABQ5IV56_9ASTR